MSDTPDCRISEAVPDYGLSGKAVKGMRRRRELGWRHMLRSREALFPSEAPHLIKDPTIPYNIEIPHYTL